MLALKCFVNFLSNKYIDANVHAYLQIGFNNIKNWLGVFIRKYFIQHIIHKFFLKHIITKIPGLSPASTLISQQRLLRKVTYDYTL